jgi:RIO kinase 1
MWELFQQNAITPDTRLTGRYRPSERRANTHAVLELIQDANYDERKRRESRGLRGGPPAVPQQQQQQRPAPHPRNGRPRHEPPGRPQPPGPAHGARRPRSGATDGQRDSRRPVEVIVARRPLTPR